MVRAAFFMEQHIGHRAYYENLRRFVESCPEIRSNWVEVNYHEEGGMLSSLPFLPDRVKATLAGRSQVRKNIPRDANIYFFNTQVPAVIGGAARLKQPYVLATDITPIQYDRMGELYNHPQERSRLLTRYKNAATTNTLRRAAQLLPWSSWVKKSLIEDYGTDPAKVEVLPPGIDLSLWHPSSPPDGPIKILFVGGDFSRKGGDILLEAYSAISACVPAGSLELLLVTRSKIPVRPGVQVFSDLHPNSPDLLRLYQSSHIFVLPSLAEAYGIAALEACAAGLPVITSRVGGFEDIVEEGTNGFLVPAGQVAPLFEALLRLVPDPALRENMGSASRERAERFFNAEKNAARLVHILDEAVRMKGQS
jgi:glycosyltransferase involved in cell wall biosynthesis